MGNKWQGFNRQYCDIIYILLRSLIYYVEGMCQRQDKKKIKRLIAAVKNEDDSGLS